LDIRGDGLANSGTHPDPANSHNTVVGRPLPDSVSEAAGGGGEVSDARGDAGSVLPSRTPPADADPPAEPMRPVWVDWERFEKLMLSRGWTWPKVLQWLKTPPTLTGYFMVPVEERRRVAVFLERLPLVHHRGPG
jgi:hypothetical protein